MHATFALVAVLFIVALAMLYYPGFAAHIA
jgi:hypothetical protein